MQADLPAIAEALNALRIELRRQTEKLIPIPNPHTHQAALQLDVADDLIRDAIYAMWEATK